MDIENLSQLSTVEDRFNQGLENISKRLEKMENLLIQLVRFQEEKSANKADQNFNKT